MSFEIEAPSRKIPGADLTPLIDVIFQLLVFFMLASSFLLPHADLELPTAQTERPAGEQPRLVLTIDKQGAFFVNSEAVEPARLEAALRAAARVEGTTEFYLQADKALPYETILEAITTGKAAGLSQIQLIHEE